MLYSDELKQIETAFLKADVIDSKELYVEVDGKLLELCGVTIKNRRLVVVPEVEL